MKRSLLILCISIIAACGGKHGNGGDDASVDASNPCGVFGTACASGTTCCSGVCDNSGSCTVNPTTCSAPGSSCSANTDCCTDSCLGGVCSANQCTADNGSCTQDGECCGDSCNNGTCTPLNANCKTAGNPCSAATDCCSQACGTNGFCSDSSYCVQNGDACAHDDECCGGICTIGAGGLGTCTEPMTGQTLCSTGVDGTVCNGCGDCCSRLCEVYQPTGVKICQPAEGCHVNGDLCRGDMDCCGATGSGLPGDGNVKCIKQNATDPVGVCRNPMSCNPEGDICHYKDYNTCGNSSARNDCCGAPGNSGVCELDALGVPRCYGLGTSCQMAGQSCAFSGDCCDGAPCVPNSNGQLVCGTTCVATSGACTNSADCCDGTSCVYEPGMTYGTCGGSTTCAQPGQDCSDTNACCDGSTCVITSTPAMDCPTGMETGCSCTTVIF